jgi:hypothetical protein
MDDQITNLPVEGEASPRAGEETEKKSCGCEECKCDPCACEKSAEAENADAATSANTETVEEKPEEASATE